MYFYPEADPACIDKLLEEPMQMAQDVSSLLLSIRKKVNIKVRQPLQKVLIPVSNKGMMVQLKKVEDLIKAEVNVKEIEYLGADNQFIQKKIKPNFVALGKRIGFEDEDGKQRTCSLYTGRSGRSKPGGLPC